MSTAAHHSIGEVLSLLKEEHPDITIAKIRFLESQGLIEPERTPSGYRKFYDPDIERLRWILTQQRENFLPLKVIKRRLSEAGFDPAAELPERDYGPLPEPALFAHRPEDESEKSDVDAAASSENLMLDLRDDEPVIDEPVSDEPVSDEPVSDEPVPAELEADPAPVPEPEPKPAPAAKAAAPALTSSSVSLTAGELAEAAGAELSLINDLERLGLIASVDVDGTAIYNDDDLVVASAAVQMSRYGFEARHLRMYKVATDRQAGVLGQIVGGQLRKSGKAREKAVDDFAELVRLGESVQRALLRRSVGGPLPD